MYERFDLIHNGVIVDMITFEELENYAKMPCAVKSSRRNSMLSLVKIC